MQTAGMLRVTLPQQPLSDGFIRGGIYIDVPDLQPNDWAEIVVRARTADMESMVVVFNRKEKGGFETFGERPAVAVRDGSVQTYRLRPRPDRREPWRQVGLGFRARAPGSIDILSVTLMPQAALYANDRVGVRDVDRQGVLRPAIFTRAPSRLSWRIKVPEGGRLGSALAVLDRRSPVTFSVDVSSASGKKPLLRETIVNDAQWHPRSIDLSAFAGQTVDLILGTGSDAGGQIAFWGTPIVSGRGGQRLPNVIVYVIDGAGADLMSLYGYNRRTTPHLERIAAEGVVFERAHSNSAWTKPSTASFMTSFHHSVMGGFRSYGDRIPEGAPTMAQRFHDAGYQTAVFTFHPNAGRSSALHRGVDRFQDHRRRGQTQSESSRFLQAEFWEWRATFPGTPYWAHFQVTDVHEPQIPVPPFQGLFVDAERRARFMGHPPPDDFDAGEGWLQQVQKAPGWERAERGEMSLAAHYREKLAELGIDRTDFYDIQRGLYDETMAHQDAQLGRFVDRIKAAGEWENTILVVTADHGHPAGSHTRFGRELFDPPPPETEGAFLDSYRTRVPLVVIAPGRLDGGARIAEPVSLIDLLPTVLDLAGLPPLERTQGRSLLPLMRGDREWERRPVILEQVERDVNTDELTGHIEMIDGRWGASLEIWPQRRPGQPPVEPSRWEAKARFHVDGQPRLLLYDLSEDPFTRQNVNERHPDLVRKYTRLLQEKWKEHQTIAALYKPSGQSALSPEQIETLRSLGYIR